MPNQPYFPAYSPDGRLLAYVNEFLDFPFAEPPPPRTIRFGDPATGTSVLAPIDLPDGTVGQIDWGVRRPDPPTCATDPALCPPPTPPECRMRFLKSRFFVFRGKPAYRLVTKYYSADAGEVRVSFFRRNADGSRGKSLGTLSRNFEAEGISRITRKVSPKVAKELRHSKGGFIADFRILPGEGFCEQAASLELTKLERIKKQYVWFLNDF